MSFKKSIPTFGKVIPSHVPSVTRTHVNSSERSKYVYFSKNTKGSVGKPVLIHADLFTRFAAAVDLNSHGGKTTIRQIENLRHSAKTGDGHLTDANSAFRHMCKANSLYIYYVVLQDNISGSTGVYIKEIKPSFGDSSDPAGLYVVKGLKNALSLTEKPVDLNDKSVYVSGLEQDLYSAANTAKSHNGSAPDAIFYNPTNVVNEMGIWNRLGQSNHTTKVVAELAKHIQYNAKKRVYWTAEGEGAAVLDQSLTHVAGELGGHRMRLVDPVADTNALLQKMKTKKVKIGGGDEDTAPITYTGQRHASQMLAAAHAESLIADLSRLRVSQLNRDAHEQMVTELKGETSGNTFGKTKSNLTRPRAQDHRNFTIQNRAPSPPSAALTFICAQEKIAR